MAHFLNREDDAKEIEEERCLVVVASKSIHLKEALKVAARESWEGKSPEIEDSMTSFGILTSGERVWTFLGPSILAGATVNKLLSHGSRRVVAIIATDSFRKTEADLAAVQSATAKIVFAPTADPLDFQDASTICAKQSAALAFFPKNFNSFTELEHARSVDAFQRFVKSQLNNDSDFSHDEDLPQDTTALRSPVFLHTPKTFSTSYQHNTEPASSNTDVGVDDEDEWLTELKSRSDEIASQQKQQQPKQTRSPDPITMQTPPRPPSANTQEQGGADSGQVRSFFEGLLTGSPVPLTPPQPSISHAENSAPAPPQSTK